MIKKKKNPPYLPWTGTSGGCAEVSDKEVYSDQRVLPLQNWPWSQLPAVRWPVKWHRYEGDAHPPCHLQQSGELVTG